MVEQTTVKLPNAMSKGELMNEGKSEKEADQIMHDRVFGARHARDKEGKVVETGIGSDANPLKSTHLAALARETERKAMANPNSADVIAKAVAAGVQAGIAAAKEAEQL